MKKFVVLAILLAFGLVYFGCDEIEDALDEYGSADPSTACGRYCIKCEACEGVGDGMIKTLMDYTCMVDEIGRLCQEICNKGSDFTDQLDIKGNIQSIEESTGKKITDEDFTCEEFALAAFTGVDNTPCFRFCSKCVECSEGHGLTSLASECAREGGIPCVEACENLGADTYVESFESYAQDNLENDQGQPVKDLSEVDCEGFGQVQDALEEESPF